MSSYSMCSSHLTLIVVFPSPYFQISFTTLSLLDYLLHLWPFISNCGWRNNGPPKHPHSNPCNLWLLPYTAKGTLQIKIRILRWESILDDPGVPSHHSGPYKRRQYEGDVMREAEREREERQMLHCASGLDDGGRDPEPRCAGGSRSCRRQGHSFSPGDSKSNAALQIPWY